MLDPTETQRRMREHRIDGWLIYDFRGSNPVLERVLGARPTTSRRIFLLVPQDGPIVLVGSSVDRSQFAGLECPVRLYTSWNELHALLRELLDGYGRVAMEYSPGGTIPMHSWVDGGTLDLVRALGLEVVSSANLYQVAVATWSAEALSSHLRAVREVNGIKDAAFAYIGERLRAGAEPTEHEVQQLILRLFAEHGLETDHGPIVAVNEHSGDPHFEPTAERHAPIRRGDWVLIDLWAKYPGDQGTYADITWVGFAGPEPSARHREVFEVVRDARDAAVARLQEAWDAGETLQGWQLDAAARAHIEQAGFGPYFTHRTGHSMGPSPTPHALGVNLDNLETHDTREVIPGVGFSVEPGIYLPEFGVRCEIDVYMDPDEGPRVTTPAQDRIILLQ